MARGSCLRGRRGKRTPPSGVGTGAPAVGDGTLGLNLREGKAILEGVQNCMVAEQVAEVLEQRRQCQRCGECFSIKAGGTTEVKTLFGAVIRRNQEFIPNFEERHRQGETISTAFVESAINQVVSHCFVKKQQMQWTPHRAHLLLQTRTKVLTRAAHVPSTRSGG